EHPGDQFWICCPVSSLVLLKDAHSAWRRSQRQRESLVFDFHEYSPDGSDAAVELGRLGVFEIGEKAPDPGRHMGMEYWAARLLRAGQFADGEPGHDLAQDTGMILRIGDVVGASNAEPSEVPAQARERPLVQKAGEIIGGIGQKLATTDADEQVEVFALDYARLGDVCSFGQCCMRSVELGFAPTQLRNLLQQRRTRWLPEQSCEQRVFQ